MTTEAEAEVTMDELFERAEREGLWFFTSYQQIWFSPRELREQQAAGHFRWGAPNWQLRDPQEYVEQAAAELRKAHDYYDRVVRNVADEKARATQASDPRAVETAPPER